MVVNTNTAGVVTRPPLLFLGALLLGFALDYLVPLPFPRTGTLHSSSVVIAGALILTGLGLFCAGILNFTALGTPVPTTQPTRALATTGVYAWTRNPIYLGMFLIYGGIGMTVHSLWILILTLPLGLVIRYGVVAREETYLERLFGDDYRDYKARVRRWL